MTVAGPHPRWNLSLAGVLLLQAGEFAQVSPPPRPYQYQFRGITSVPPLNGNRAFAFKLTTGDINGDGFPELIVPAQAADRAPFGLNEGEIWVYDGVTRRLNAYLFIDNVNQRDTQLLGFGIAAGDLNGDGFGEVAACYIDNLNGAVQTRIWYGPDLTTFRDLSNKGDGTGPNCEEGLTIRDFDGDGIGDLIGFNPNYETVSVYRGPDLALIQRIPLATNTQGLNDWMTVADFNGDGNLDFAIAGPNHHQPSYLFAGAVWVMWGPDYTPVMELKDTTPRGGGRFGVGLSAGDVNGDGLEDLLVSVEATDCPWAYTCGEFYVFFGPDLTTYRVFEDPVLPQPPVLGWYNTTVGDLNGDGHPDLAVSANGYYHPTKFITSALAILLGPTFDETQWEFILPRGNQRNEGMIWDMAVADFNRDGRDDVVLGQPNLRMTPLFAPNGRALILDFASRSSVYQFGWSTPARETIHLDALISDTGTDDVTLTVQSDLRQPGVLVSSLRRAAIPLVSPGFDGREPTTVPTLLVDPASFSRLIPYLPDDTGRFDVTLARPAAFSNFEEVYFQAVSFGPDRAPCHSRGLAVQLP